MTLMASRPITLEGRLGKDGQQVALYGFGPVDLKISCRWLNA